MGPHAIQGPLIVSIRHESVDILNELVDTLAVVRGELFYIVMAGAIDVVWWIFVLGGPVKLLCMIERYDFVSLAMDYVDRTVDVRHPIYVGELVER